MLPLFVILLWVRIVWANDSLACNLSEKLSGTGGLLTGNIERSAGEETS